MRMWSKMAGALLVKVLKSSGALWKLRWLSWVPPSWLVLMVSVCVKQHVTLEDWVKGTHTACSYTCACVCVFFLVCSLKFYECVFFLFFSFCFCQLKEIRRNNKTRTKWNSVWLLLTFNVVHLPFSPLPIRSTAEFGAKCVISMDNAINSHDTFCYECDLTVIAVMHWCCFSCHWSCVCSLCV